MPLTVDAILGQCYVSNTDFTARAAAYGVTLPVGYDSNALTALLATASRLIDTNRRVPQSSYGGTPVTENFLYDYVTRRIYLAQHPIVSVSGVTIQLGANPQTALNLSTIFIDLDAGYLELPVGSQYLNPLVVNTYITSTTREAHVTVTYTPSSNIPGNIAAACIVIACDLFQQAVAQQLVPGDIGEIDVADVHIRQSRMIAIQPGYTLPLTALDLLGPRRGWLV